jgi:hypothetical protein
MADRTEEKALLRFASHGGRPAVTPLEQMSPRGQPQPPLRFHVPVTLKALLDQERTYFLLEEFDLAGRRVRRSNQGPRRPERQEQDERKATGG